MQAHDALPLMHTLRFRCQAGCSYQQQRCLTDQRWPDAGCMACSTVELVAARSIPQDSELSISYGDRPLRDFLRGYAFTPGDSRYEVRSCSESKPSNAHYIARRLQMRHWSSPSLHRGDSIL